MSFYAKVIGGFVALLLVALGFVFLFRTSDEKAIENLLKAGLESASEGEEEKVVALISPNYKNGEETRDGIVRRIRNAVKQRITPAKLKGAAIQVSGDDADASMTIEVGMLQYRQEFAIWMKLRRENGEWKVVAADQTR
jgi:hypothetical protein